MALDDSLFFMPYFLQLQLIRLPIVNQNATKNDDLVYIDMKKKYTKPKEALKTESVHIRFTPFQKKQLEAQAYLMGVSISQLIKKFLPL